MSTTHVLYGRRIAVVAEFPNTPAGIKDANAYMELHPGVGLLDATGTRVILSRNDDKGVKA
jgi:hypothetical protein